MFIAVFGVIQVVLFLMHAATYQALAAAFGLRWPWLAWLFGLLSVTYVSAEASAHWFCNTFVRIYYRISAYWFGLIIFLYGGTLGFYFSELILFSHNEYVSPALLGTIWFGGAFLIHSIATWKTFRIEMTRLDITLPNLPEFWRGKKFVFVSDVHLGAVRGERLARKVVRYIQNEKPEMVLIGGDIFDGVKCHPASLIKPFAELHPPQGVLFASGNHEYIEDTEVMLREIRGAGIRVLPNEVADIHGLQVIGVDWKDTHRGEHFKKILADMKIDGSKPSILMKHEPNDIPIAADAGISLQLSGHTHQGQIFPLRYITKNMYNGFDYGLKRLGNMMVYTSSGVGTWGPPLRFITKSEILVITLK